MCIETSLSAYANCSPWACDSSCFPSQFRLDDDSALSVLTYAIDQLGVEHGALPLTSLFLTASQPFLLCSCRRRTHSVRRRSCMLRGCQARPPCGTTSIAAGPMARAAHGYGNEAQSSARRSRTRTAGSRRGKRTKTGRELMRSGTSSQGMGRGKRTPGLGPRTSVRSRKRHIERPRRELRAAARRARDIVLEVSLPIVSILYVIIAIVSAYISLGVNEGCCGELGPSAGETRDSPRSTLTPAVQRTCLARVM